MRATAPARVLAPAARRLFTCVLQSSGCAAKYSRASCHSWGSPPAQIRTQCSRGWKPACRAFDSRAGSCASSVPRPCIASCARERGMARIDKSTDERAHAAQPAEHGSAAPIPTAGAAPPDAPTAFGQHDRLWRIVASSPPNPLGQPPTAAFRTAPVCASPHRWQAAMSPARSPAAIRTPASSRYSRRFCGSAAVHARRGARSGMGGRAARLQRRDVRTHWLRRSPRTTTAARCG